MRTIICGNHHLCVMPINFVIIIVFFTHFMSGCKNLCDTELIEEIKSRDENLKVSIVRKNCGATTSLSTFLYLNNSNISNNDAFTKENLFFQADKVADLKVFWQNSETVVVIYSKARIFFFSNFWQGKVDNKWKEVNFIERQLNS